MPNRAHSIDSTLVRFSTAARAADEWAMAGSPGWGERVTFTILPPPAGIIALVATAWVISHVPSTFSRMTVRKPLGVMSSAGTMYWPPALFTSTSMRPWRSRTPSTRAATWSSSRMSHSSAWQRPSSAIEAVSSIGSRRRPHTTTPAPHAPTPTPGGRPRPGAPPPPHGHPAIEDAGGEQPAGHQLDDHRAPLVAALVPAAPGEPRP